ncbi:hypothetical protein D3C81_1311800 [compost metagenome]
MQGRSRGVNSFVVEYFIHYILTGKVYFVPCRSGWAAFRLPAIASARCSRKSASTASRANPLHKAKRMAEQAYLPNFTRVQSRVMMRAKLMGWSGIAYKVANTDSGG